MLQIKVCGMKYHENMLKVAALDPDLMGFIFYPPSPRFIGINPAKGLFETVPPGIRKAGVFVDSDFSVISQTCRKYGLQLAQLHGHESPALAKQLRTEGIQVIKAIHLSSEKDFEKIRPFEGFVDYFLFEAPSGAFGGSGIKFPWHILETYPSETPFFLSGGIGPGDEAHILSLSLSLKYLAGVDINSRFETQPGLKDTDKVKTFIEAIKNQQR